MSMTESGTGNGAKGFWALGNMRPDSVAAKLLLLAGGTYAAYKLLPIINTIVWNAVSIAIGGGILAALAVVIIDGRLVRLFDYVYRLGVRGLVGFFVTLDPIGIMKNYLQDIVKTVREFSERIADLRGAIDTTKEDLAQYQKEYEEAMAYVQAARKKGNEGDPTVRTQSAIAERRRATISDLTKLITMMEAILSLLERYYNKSVAYRDDLKDDISFTERKRKTLKIASSAFNKARSILSGDTIGAEFYDAAVEASKQQAGAMVGEMKQWVFESQDVIKTFEMKQDAAVEQVLQRLQQKEESGDSLLLEYQPGTIVPLLADSTKPAATPVPVGQSVDRFLNN